MKNLWEVTFDAKKDRVESNYQSTLRANFELRACLLWVRENHPEVAKAIKAEAYKRWPPPNGSRQRKTDYSFLSDVSA